MEINPLETRSQRLFIPNAMLLLYLVSVSLGITVTIIIGHFTVGFFEGQLMTALYRYGPYYDFPIAIISVLIILVYERPIRRVLQRFDSSKGVAAGELLVARRRLLNEPFFLIALDLLTWLGAAGYYSLLFQRFADRPELARLLVFNSVLTAIISVVTTYFFLQYGLQRWLIPVFFPQGGLSRVRGAWRITLSTRLATLVMATSLVPLFIVGVSLFAIDINDLTEPGTHSLPNLLSNAIFVELVLFTLMAIILTYLYKPDTDSFEELVGQGLALGVDQDRQYPTYTKVIHSGQLLLMTTDGIFETRRHGQMFGKKRFKEIVRCHHDLNAAGIRKEILAAVDGFRGPERQEDDVTLVVMKFL